MRPSRQIPHTLDGRDPQNPAPRLAIPKALSDKVCKIWGSLHEKYDQVMKEADANKSCYFSLLMTIKKRAEALFFV